MSEPSILEKIAWLLERGVKITWAKYNQNGIWMPNQTFGDETWIPQVTSIPNKLTLYTNRTLEEAKIAVDNTVERMLQYEAHMESLIDSPEMLFLKADVENLNTNA